jgi:hypothetical protein
LQGRQAIKKGQTMDKSTKMGRLIRLQFFALWMMICLTLWMTIYARGANDLQAFWKTEVDFILPEMGRLERQHDDDQRIIRDLNKRLEQYEPKPVTDDKCVSMTLKVVSGTLTGQIADNSGTPLRR